MLLISPGYVSFGRGQASCWICTAGVQERLLSLFWRLRGLIVAGKIVEP